MCIHDSADVTSCIAEALMPDMTGPCMRFGGSEAAYPQQDQCGGLS